MTFAPEPVDPALRGHAAALEYPGRPDVAASVRVRHRGRRERTLRAARTLAACWGLAIIAVFLPVLHFVLVPALLMLGPALAWSRFHEARTLVRADGACPACALPLHLELGQPWRERTILRCDGCGRRLTLLLPPAADG